MTRFLGVTPLHDLEPLESTVLLYFRVPLVLTARVSGRKNPTAHSPYEKPAGDPGALRVGFGVF